MSEEERKEEKKVLDSNILKEIESLKMMLVIQINEQIDDENVTDYYIGERGVMNRAIRIYKRDLMRKQKEFYQKQNENNGGELSPIEIDKMILKDMEDHPIDDRHKATIKNRETIGKVYADDARIKAGCKPEDIEREVFKDELVAIEGLANDVIAMIPEEILPMLPRKKPIEIKREHRAKKLKERLDNNE